MSVTQIILTILIVLGVGTYGFFSIRKAIQLKKGTYKPKKRKKVEDNDD